MRLFVAVLMASVCVGDVATACRNPADQRSTLLRQLPSNAFNEAVVAKVEIIEIVNNSEVNVKVLEAVKGTQVDQTFKLNTGGSSCDQYLRYHRIGEQAYIAGRFIAVSGKAELVFFGPWRYSQSDLMMIPFNWPVEPSNP